MEVLGIDIGGSGIKGAPVDTNTGMLLAERYRLATPKPATPDAVGKTISSIVQHFKWEGQIGIGYPGVIRHGHTLTAANVSDKWIGLDARAHLEEATCCAVTLINDADAAGLAEVRFGAGKGRRGVILILTLGTGIGTALFTDGLLVPNTELGHLELNGKEAEKWASDAARSRKNLSWKKWAKRLNVYLERMSAYFWPDLIILGGGVSKRTRNYLPYLTVDVDIVPAVLRNEAGIIGAALAATGESRPRRTQRKVLS